MTTELAVITETGCVEAADPTGTNVVPVWDGSCIVWLAYSGSGSSNGDCACITSAEIVNGRLIINFDDGTSLDAGAVTSGGSLPTGTINQILVNDGNSFVAVDSADRPFRIAGATGTDGQLDQPTSINNVGVSDTIQHIGNVLLGGSVSVSDVAEEQLHIKGNQLIEDAIPETEYRQAAALLGMFVRHVQEAQMDSNVLAVMAGPANTPDRYVRQVDALGNYANADALQFGVNGASQVWHSVDRPGVFNRQTNAPTSPLSPYQTGRFTTYYEWT